MRHGKALPPAVNEWIRQQLLAWLEEDPSRTRAALAQRLSISAAHMTNVLKHGRGAGASLEEDVAALLGIGVEELRRRANEAWQEPTDSAVRVVHDDRYPNRAIAVAFMRGWVSEPAIEEALSYQLQSDTDLEPKAWADLIEAAHKRLSLDIRRPERVAERDARAEAAGDDLEAATAPRRKARAKA